MEKLFLYGNHCERYWRCNDKDVERLVLIKGERIISAIMIRGVQGNRSDREIDPIV